MGSANFTVASLLFAVLAGCSGPLVEDETDGSQGAIKGSPTEETASNEAQNNATYFDKIDAAYDQAKLDEFTAIDAKSLTGEAAADFATMTKSCTADKSYKVSSQRWSGRVPTSPSNSRLVQRGLFTLDAYSSKNKKTMFVGVYDERGTLITSREYFEEGFELLRTKGPAAYRALIATCAPPRYALD